MRSAKITHQIKPYGDGSGYEYAVTVIRTEKQPTGCEWSIQLEGCGGSRIDFNNLADWRDFKEAVEAAIAQSVGPTP
jgi:hypothetical protein